MTDKSRPILQNSAIVILLCLFLSLLNRYIPSYFPSFGDIVQELTTGWWEHRFFSSGDGWGNSFWTTFYTTLIAVSVGSLLGLIIPLLVYPIFFIRSLIEHALAFFIAIPPLLSVPFFLTVITYNNHLASLMAAMLYAFLGTAIYTFAALEHEIVKCSAIVRQLSSKWGQQALLVYLPSIFPYWVSCVKVITSISLGIIIVAEYFLNHGLGFALRCGQDKNSLPTVFVTIFLSIILVFLLEIGICFIIPLIRSVHRLQQRYPKCRYGYYFPCLRTFFNNLITYFTKMYNCCKSFKRPVIREPISFQELGGILLSVIEVIVAVAGFWLVFSQLDAQKISQAWQTLIAASGKPGDAGRLQAIQDLAKSKQSLSSVDLSYSFLKGGNVVKGQLDSSNFDGTILEHLNLIESNLFKATFKGATLKFVKFSNCNFSNASFGELNNTKIGHSDPKYASVENSEFIAVTPQRKNESGEQADFKATRFRQVSFTNVSLSGAIFTDSIGTKLSFISCLLHGARYSNAHIPEARFFEVSANQATEFRNTNLEKTVFENSELISTDFSKANLQGSQFINSCIFALNLDEADLRKSNLFIYNSQSQSACLSRMKTIIETQKWDESIRIIKNANINGMVAPEGFYKWALSKGAFDEPNTQKWKRSILNE